MNSIAKSHKKYPVTNLIVKRIINLQKKKDSLAKEFFDVWSDKDKCQIAKEFDLICKKLSEIQAS